MYIYIYTLYIHIYVYIYIAEGQASYGAICLHHPPPRWHLLRSQQTYPIFDEQSQIGPNSPKLSNAASPYRYLCQNNIEFISKDLKKWYLAEQCSAKISWPNMPNMPNTARDSPAPSDHWSGSSSGSRPSSPHPLFGGRPQSKTRTQDIGWSDDKAGQAKAQTHEGSGEHDACWEVFGLCLRFACLAPTLVVN